MNNKVYTLLTAAVVSGLLAGAAAKAEDNATEKKGDPTVSDKKEKCKGMKAEESCQGKSAQKHKKKKKGSCSQGCGGQKDEKSQPDDADKK